MKKNSKMMVFRLKKCIFAAEIRLKKCGVLPKIRLKKCITGSVPMTHKHAFRTILKEHRGQCILSFLSQFVLHAIDGCLEEESYEMLVSSF